MDKELIKLLRSLCEPSLSEFIDWDKFLLSPKFTKISQSLIEHFQNNGESIFINRLLPNSSPKCDTLQFKRLASFLQKPWLAA